jgi:hypothetical protein
LDLRFGRWLALDLSLVSTVKKLSALALALVSLLWLTGATWLPLFVAATSSFSLVLGGSASSSNTSLTTIDYGTVTYASGCTRVIAAAQWYTGGTISGITIGGTALAQISGAHVTNSSIADDMWESSASLAGSSGDVQITYSAAPNYTSSVALYCLKTTTPISSAQATNGFNATATVSAPITIPSGGGAIAITQSQFGTSLSSWTNAATDTTVTLGGTQQVYAHTTATGSTTITATYSGSTDGGALSVVAWGP